MFEPLTSLQDGVILAKGGHWSQIRDAIQVAKTQGLKYVLVPEGLFNLVNVGEEITTFDIPEDITVFAIFDELDADGLVVNYKTQLIIPWAASGGVPYGAPIPTIMRFVGSENYGHGGRFRGVKFVGYRSVDPTDTHKQRIFTVDRQCDWVFEYCEVEHICGGAWIGSIANSKYRGLIHHSKFINYYGEVHADISRCTLGYGVGVGAAGSDIWEPDIYKVLGKYTDQTVFIEHSYFSKWRHCVAANEGAHYVFRHNKINEDFGFGSLDAHGTYNKVGTRAMEIYDNDFTNSMYGWGSKIIFWRGGGGVFFGNRLDGSYDFIELIAEGSIEKCWPHNIYVWDNINQPAVTVSVSKTGSDGIVHPKLGLDYFVNTPMPNYVPYESPHPLSQGQVPEPEYKTPFTASLEEGDYTVNMPIGVTVGSDTYQFKEWTDGFVFPERTINLLSDTYLRAKYQSTALTATIRGIVKDATTELPLSGVTVLCDSFSTVTNPDGSFEFADIPAVSYTMTAQKLGYQTQRFPVDATGGGEFTVEIPLSPTPSISRYLPLAPIAIGLTLSAGKEYLPK